MNMINNIAIADAVSALLSCTTPVGVEEAALFEAGGRVLAEDLAAKADLPPFHRSAYDGFALRSAGTAGASDASPAVFRIAGTVAAGDFSTALPEEGCCVRIGNRMYRQIGRICMDQFMVDVTPVDDADARDNPVQVGDAVTLFGGDDGQMTDTLARMAGTINYEVVCKVSKRVPRIVE